MITHTIRRFALSTSLSLSLLCAMTPPVWATAPYLAPSAETLTQFDGHHRGQVTVTLINDNRFDDQAAPTTGVPVLLAQIADVDLLDPTAWNFHEPETTRAYVNAAQQLASSDIAARYTQTTDSNGTATFNDLPIGVYVVLPAEAEKNFFHPLVLSVPHYTPLSGALTLSVSAYPKPRPTNDEAPTPEPQPIPTTSVQPPPPATPEKAHSSTRWALSLAHTGANTVWLALIGIVLLACGLLLFLRRYRHHPSTSQEPSL
ncbi:MAG: prealbumin-like fold domain-containing protein [Corynebacterium sp.]|uniref:prealbumin-like fold domain-containing protein n=1 Tax=Corynebacterium sp. TaxID=1720 RepID=UPI0026DAFA5D|nr:prealbumin-like fold domain-containing protein [Corynebacterium sp.]MDO4760775.1 prealbumin-like fold domain-containing protein [Corynebacterium sp.]